MAEKKVIEVEVQSNLGSLKSQLREATAAVAEMSERFGATSEQAIKAAKRAAELKDAIGDAKALTDAFNPDAKFKSLTAAMSGSLNGFAAVQGAMGLVGTESSKVNEMLLKVQSAMALAQGIDGLLEAKDSFKTLFSVIKSGFSSMKAAIASTGIGLLVVGIGLVAANWDKVKSSTEKASKSFTDYLNSSSKGAKALKWYLDALVYPITLVIKAYKEVKDLIMGTSDASRKADAEAKKAHEKRIAAFDAERKAQQQALSDLDLKIQLLEAEGKSSVELRKKKIALQKADAESTLQALEATKAILGKNNIMAKSYDDLINASKNTLQKIAVDEKRLAKEVSDAEAEKRNARKEANSKRAEDQEKANDEAWQKEQDRLKDERESEEYWTNFLSTEDQKRADNEKAKQDKINADAEEAAKFRGELYAWETQKALEEDQKKEDNRKKSIEAWKGMQSGAFQFINDLADLFAGKDEESQRRAFKVKKAAGIAQATIDTYQAAAGAYKSQMTIPTPDAPIRAAVAAAFAVASGLARIKAIASTKFEGGGSASSGGGGGAASMPTASSNPANFNIVGNSGTNQLAETLSNKPMKAYVVSGEMSSAQSLERNRIKTSSL